MWRSYLLAPPAKTYGKIRRTEEGLALIAGLAGTCRYEGERFHEAELYRLKGEMMLQSRVGGQDAEVQKEAEGCFHQALVVARRQDAKSLLNSVLTTNSLARPRQSPKVRRKKLTRYYPLRSHNWFTKGFDAKDLNRPKASRCKRQIPSLIKKVAGTGRDGWAQAPLQQKPQQEAGSPRHYLPGVGQ